MKYSLCTSGPSPLLLVLNAYGQLLLHDIFLFYFEVRYGSFVSGEENEWEQKFIFWGYNYSST